MGLGSSTAQTREDYAFQSRFGLIEKYCDLTGKKILDIGCGNGVYSIEMAKHASSVIGVDINPDSIRQALIQKENKRINNIDFFCCDVEKLVIKEKFDIIVMIEVLEHFKEEKLILNHLKDYLVNKGEIILFIPNKLYPFEVHGMHIFGKNLHFKGSAPFLSWAPARLRKKFVDEKIYTKNTIAALLQNNGFEITTIDFIFPPLDFLKIPGKNNIRKFLLILQNTPLKIFGMSIFCIAKKKTNV